MRLRSILSNISLLFVYSKKSTTSAAALKKVKLIVACSNSSMFFLLKGVFFLTKIDKQKKLQINTSITEHEVLPNQVGYF